jgi:pentose-5-phosphate-3-epimerase
MTPTCARGRNRSAVTGIYKVQSSEPGQRSGDQVDQQLKQLMKELGEAINESLSDSEQIAEVVSRIKEGGYDIFLVLEATIGVSKQGEKSSDKTSLVTTLSTNPEFKISDQDLKFLKSLRIKIEEEKEK